MNRKLFIFLIISIFFIIFFLIYYKTKNNGNTINRLTNNLEDYILNISSYEAELEVTIESNKTTNKYKLKQLYYKPNLINISDQKEEMIKLSKSRYSNHEKLLSYFTQNSIGSQCR